MIKHGADLFGSIDGDSYLILTAAKGQLRIVEFLVNQGLLVNAKGMDLLNWFIIKHHYN